MVGNSNETPGATIFKSKLKPRSAVAEEVKKKIPSDLERRGEAWLRLASREGKLPSVDPAWKLPNAVEIAAYTAFQPDIIVQTLCARRSASSPYMVETLEQIERDLPRTYPDVDFFANTDVKNGLGQILRAVAIAYPETGYVQGMNFLAANVLLHMRGAMDKTFLLIRYMMEAPRYRLVNVFQEGLPNLRRFTDLLADLMAARHPSLHRHFDEIGLEPLFYSQNWTVTLFSYMVPFSPLAKIWDRFFEHGWEAIFKHGLAFFEINLDTLLVADFESAAVLLRTTAERPPSNLSSIADGIRLTPDEVRRIACAVQQQDQYVSPPVTPATHTMDDSSSVATLSQSRLRRASIGSSFRDDELLGAQLAGCGSPATILTTESPRTPSFFDMLGGSGRRRLSDQGPRLVDAKSLAYGVNASEPSPGTISISALQGSTCENGDGVGGIKTEGNARNAGSALWM
ncbi:TBC1 domain family member 10A [Hondaea fermentalgiana]|uniref:TBC1 domain family member 10A n=1 Tax=Hondaea fermentalgiana TaxID=2315210 RepID=A0A2R5GIM6_9STRA|nr:TBC1 domain family member 10A [Hondaea fermentalgiana]|eukprot:GBG27724.1 TBC1 domain family member 10A [Hondaea fermentalgiana]